MSATARTRHTAIRFKTADLETIDQEAARRGMSRTEYIVRASTGTLTDTVGEAMRRIEALEAAVHRLEQTAY